MIETGKLDFFSETGTEGGYYCLQRGEYIEYTPSPHGVFTNQMVYDPENIFREGRVLSAYNKDGSRFSRGESGAVSYLDIEWCDENRDIARASDSVLVEQWGYEGSYKIQNKDSITIYSKGIGSAVLWEGVVLLEPQDSYSENSYSAKGMGVHHEPVMLDCKEDKDSWTQFFFEKKWAQVVLTKRTK